MLEESDVIDLITEKDGQQLLVISDAAITDDPAERRRLLAAKLRTYAAALAKGDLPIITDSRQVQIRVVCADQPTAVYDGPHFLDVTPPSGEPFRVPILYQHLANPFARR